MICSVRSYEKCLKEGLSPNSAAYKATYLYVYLAETIGKIKGRLRRDPYNEIHQEHLAMVQRNKDILLAAKTDEKVHYICDKLIRDHFHNFNLGGGQ